MEKQQLVCPSRQCSSTQAGFVSGFLSEELCDNTGVPPYSPGLAPADFELLPLANSALKGRRFCDGADSIKNATKELKRLSQNDIQECFDENTHFCQSLEEVCIFIGSLFWRKCSLIDCTVFISHK
jgi:hypothetical protein